MHEFPTVVSPCVSICKLDKNSICIGCYRSAREIQNWYLLDDDGRKKILENVEQRKVNKNENDPTTGK